MGGNTRYSIVHGRGAADKVRSMGPNKREKISCSGFFDRTPLCDGLGSIAPPQNEPVKESGTYTRRDSVADTITTSALQACSEIAEAVSEYDRHREVHEEKIRRLLDALSAREINNLRYRLFAPHYDDHMEGHEGVISLLMRQIPPIERLAVPFRPAFPVISNDILELSCGTGTMVRILAKALPHKRARMMRVTANDLSENMKAIAKKKLEGFPGKIEFTDQDIHELSMGRKFGTILLAQTLHLITDEEVVRQERQANYMHVDSDRHFEAKFRVIERAWDHLKTGGTMIVVDEWPALLSDRGGPLGPGFAYLFNDSLREIGYMDFSFSVMGQMPGSRLVAHLKAPIDSKHAMYFMIYRKEDWDRASPSVLPECNENSVLRTQLMRRNLAIFKAINRRFIEGFEVSGGEPWVRFRIMDSHKTLILKDGMQPGGSEKYNCVVVDRMLQNMPGDERHGLIRGAIEALKVGGSLIFIDEWPSNRSQSHPIEIADLKTVYMKRYAKHLVYGGALRLPLHENFDSGMFGFQMWRVL